MILFFQLPFALIPLVKFCGSERVVGTMALSPRALRLTHVLTFVIVAANVVLIIQMIASSGMVDGSVGGVFAGLFVAVAAVAYCASLAALARRPVSQDLTDRWSARLRPRGGTGEEAGDQELHDGLEY